MTQTETAVSASATLSALAPSAGEVEFVEISNEIEQITTLAPSDFAEGQSFVAHFLGTWHTHTKKVMANWKEIIVDGTKLYENKSYRFRNPSNGEVFGLWQSPTLKLKLEKILTASSSFGKIASDPLVKITYVGLIHGADELAKHGVELLKGDKSHVFKVEVEKSALFDTYVKGCVNSLNSPTPSIVGKSTLTQDEATKANYERLLALQGVQGVQQTLIS